MVLVYLIVLAFISPSFGGVCENSGRGFDVSSYEDATLGRVNFELVAVAPSKGQGFYFYPVSSVTEDGIFITRGDGSQFIAKAEIEQWIVGEKSNYLCFFPKENSNNHLFPVGSCQ